MIDGDLGKSESGRSKRPGFAQLVTSVSLGEVGAVLELEISHLARSSSDFMKHLELCGPFGSLVIDENGIYNMSDFSDRLLIDLKTSMSESELHFLHTRMIGGKENAAPIGYIYDSGGGTITDSNKESMRLPHFSKHSVLQEALMVLFDISPKKPFLLQTCL